MIISNTVTCKVTKNHMIWLISLLKGTNRFTVITKLSVMLMFSVVKGLFTTFFFSKRQVELALIFNYDPFRNSDLHIPL